MSWRLASLLREALLNLRANGARTAFVLLAAVAVPGALAFLELRQADDLRSFERSLMAAGGYVAVASGQGGLPASRCAALNGQPGVVAAGGVRAHGQATFAAQPGVLPGEAKDNSAVHARRVHGDHQLLGRGELMLGVFVKRPKPNIACQVVVPPGPHFVREDMRMKIDDHGTSA